MLRRAASSRAAIATLRRAVRSSSGLAEKGGAGAVVVAVAVGGCGLGPGPGTSNVTLTVSRGFGATRIGQVSVARVPGSETVLRMLERHFRVSTRYGGGFVESIAGLSGSPAHVDWFYYVNGVEAPRGAAATVVHRGDRIWWDLHDWSATQSTPAVVGSFPEPFLHGVGGKRLPTTVECAADTAQACKRVSAALSALGVPVATQQIGTGSGTDTLGVVVGTWRDLGGEIVASLIDHGPSASGVYARFAGRSGSELQLMNPRGEVVRTLGAAAGLIAATAEGGSVPTWVITGTDRAGVSAAAGALGSVALRDRFALAVQGPERLPVPLEGPS
jgi:hypothetical protein